MLEKPFVSYLSESIIKNWDISALADYQGNSFKYGEIGMYIIHLHKFFESLEIKQGDKIAIVGKNSTRWCILYLAAVTYGTVVVPIFPEFKPNDLKEILIHSDSVFLFAEDKIIKALNFQDVKAILGIIRIDDFTLVESQSEKIKEAYEKSEIGTTLDVNIYSKEMLKFPEISNDKLAVLSYTSGTTGFTKGVMLSHNSLAANIRYAQNNMPLKPGDKIVSLLPLAHTFGCAFEFLFPFTLGCHVTILTKTPSPQIIMKAFKEIKPALILSVPLVVEKIYKNKLIPVLSKSYMKLLLNIPGINQIILKKFKEQLTAFFGGNFKELVLGGAPFSQEAEKFFRKIKFKYTVGYGMTECGPLISYNKWSDLPAGSCGKIVDTLEVKIEKESPEHKTGEICVRGENVMDGYYKNEEDTKKVLDKEGWLYTGDLGYINDDGFIFIKGRSKSMILGPSGKNIYPEEIEAMLNNCHGVGETVVVDRNGKLVALVYPDGDFVKKQKLKEKSLLKIYDHHLKHINHKLPKYMNVSSIEIHHEEFVKTPKRNVKRFLYK